MPVPGCQAAHKVRKGDRAKSEQCEGTWEIASRENQRQRRISGVKGAA